MSSASKLSFSAATLISINIMLGTGVFINTVKLAQKTGAAGCLLYIIMGTIMFPIVLSIARLSSINQQASLYTFGALVHPFLGFLSTWSYFFAKLASASFSMHVFNTFLQKTAPFLSHISTILLDIILITLFTLLNTLDVQIGKRIQTCFLSMKVLLFTCALTIGLWKMNYINVMAPCYIWEGIPVGLPLVVFCFLGFEASCSLTNKIDSPQKNAPRAIITAFSIVVTLVTLYQFLFYAAVGADGFAQNANYTDAFPLLITTISKQLASYLAPLFSIAIAISALGGSYGIMYINGWNLYRLAQSNLIPAAQSFTHLNRHGIPLMCIFAQGLTCVFFLVTTGGEQIPLVYTAVLGSITTYAISVLGFYQQTYSKLAFAGLASCALLLGFSLFGFLKTSLAPLFIFCTILAIGSLFYYYKQK